MKNIRKSVLFSFLFLSSLSSVRATDMVWQVFLSSGAGTATFHAVKWIWENPNECSRRVRILAGGLFCCCRNDPEQESRVSYLFPPVMPIENVHLVNILNNSLDRYCPAQFQKDLGDGYEYDTPGYTFQLRRFRPGIDPEFSRDAGVSPAISALITRVRGIAHANGSLSNDFFTRIESAHSKVVDGWPMIQYGMQPTDPLKVFVRIHAGEETNPFVFVIEQLDHSASNAALARIVSTQPLDMPSGHARSAAPVNEHDPLIRQ